MSGDAIDELIAMMIQSGAIQVKDDVTKSIVSWIPVITSVVTLAGVLVGVAATVLTEKIRNAATHAREREARESLRRDTLNERRNEFQRKTLLELQDAALMLIQATSALDTAANVVYRKTGIWHGEAYPDDLDEAAKFANARTALLGVRVRDEQVRKLLQQLKDNLWAVPMPHTKREKAQSLMNEAGNTFVALNVRIGTVLRTLDEAE